MIFLKKFYAEGFKSFARPTTLNFDSTMIGIVGPNGSGKSNIVDGLKWAMGEQSVKSLRGKEKSNLIFAGSNDLKESDYALVELTFDNTSRILHFDSDVVKITRKLMRKTGENFYFLNDEPCQLKEIQTAFVDTGLAKGSLGIITQGSVNWFAEAKPEERRKMFESAAGIGKYINQKQETEKHLEKAAANLEGLSSSLATLRRDVKELNKQADKAKEFKEKKDKLKLLDLSISVQDYLSWTAEATELDEKITIEDENLDSLNIWIQNSRDLKERYETEFTTISDKFKDLTNQRNNLKEQIDNLNIKRAKHLANLESNLFSNSIEERINSYNTLLASERGLLSSFKTQLEEYTENNKEVIATLEDLAKNKTKIANELEEVKVEYNTKKNKYDVLLKQSTSMNTRERGVETIIKAKNNFPGVHSTLQNLISVNERYETAILTALGKSITNVVVDTDEEAVKAINFLKRNHAGRATFLPLNTIKPKEIAPSTLTIMRQMNGFVDIASNLIECEDQYKNVISSILGNVGVTDTIENANYISRAIRSTYKLISLDGDIIFAGGALTGGEKQHLNSSLFNIEEKLQQAEQELNDARTRLNALNSNYNQVSYDFDSLSVKKQSNETFVDKLGFQIEQSQRKITNYESDLESLNVSKDESANKSMISDIDQSVLDLQTQYSKINKEYEETDKLKENAFNNMSKYSSEYMEKQEKINKLAKTNYEHKNRLNLLNANITTLEDRILADYAITIKSAVDEYNNPPEDMTISEARRIIATLKAEINALGNTINFQALDALEEKQKQLETLEKETSDARDSVNSMVELIKSLDKKAKENFVAIIDKVNETLPTVFKSLFGGGYCKISITDPDNILESGIDVVAQPPGKKVTNLVLLSGGEKTLIALAVLFSILKSSRFPLVLLDEAEAALDQANVNTFAKLIEEFSDVCQFLVITHRTGTMKICPELYGVVMQVKGVTDVIKTSYEKVKNEKFAQTAK